MRYISDLKDGSSVKDIYLCKKRQSLVTRAGKAYESLTFQDKKPARSMPKSGTRTAWESENSVRWTMWMFPEK